MCAASGRFCALALICANCVHGCGPAGGACAVQPRRPEREVTRAKWHSGRPVRVAGLNLEAFFWVPGRRERQGVDFFRPHKRRCRPKTALIITASRHCNRLLS